MEKQKLNIIKIGGNVINDPNKIEAFLANFSTIEGCKILVHGGGKILDSFARKMGVQQEMIDGRRVTNKSTLELSTMVYAGLLNKQICATLQSNNTNAIGLSGADGNAIQTSKRENQNHDFGFVGDLNKSSVNTTFFTLLLQNDITPIVCAITHDKKGQLLNTNADTLASEIAIALSKDFDVQLNYCFEKKGVLMDVEDDNSFLRKITSQEYKKLLENKVVSKGMIPKLDTAFKAIESGVTVVVIAHSDELSNVIAHKENSGTFLVS